MESFVAVATPLVEILLNEARNERKGPGEFVGDDDDEAAEMGSFSALSLVVRIPDAAGGRPDTVTMLWRRLLMLIKSSESYAHASESPA